jgi:hypothetical protein
MTKMHRCRICHANAIYRCHLPGRERPVYTCIAHVSTVKRLPPPRKRKPSTLERRVLEALEEMERKGLIRRVGDRWYRRDHEQQSNPGATNGGQ